MAKKEVLSLKDILKRKEYFKNKKMRLRNFM